MAAKNKRQADAALDFGCSQNYVSEVIAGHRLPGRMIANAIERVTAGWKDGPIRSEEWDAEELRQSKRKKAA